MFPDNICVYSFYINALKYCTVMVLKNTSCQQENVQEGLSKASSFIPTKVNGEFQQWQESSASNKSILQYLKSKPFAKDSPLVLQYKNYA